MKLLFGAAILTMVGSAAGSSWSIGADGDVVYRCSQERCIANHPGSRHKWVSATGVPSSLAPVIAVKHTTSDGMWTADETTVTFTNANSDGASYTFKVTCACAASGFFVAPATASLAPELDWRAAARFAFVSYVEDSKRPTTMDGFTLDCDDSDDNNAVYYNDANKQVVVAIRGTAAAEDVLTDAPCLVDFNGISITYRYAEEVTLLAKLRVDYPGYQFEVTGHSLGGTLTYELLKANSDARGHSFNPCVAPFNPNLNPEVPWNTNNTVVHHTANDPASYRAYIQWPDLLVQHTLSSGDTPSNSGNSRRLLYLSYFMDAASSTYDYFSSSAVDTASYLMGTASATTTYLWETYVGSHSIGNYVSTEDKAWIRNHTGSCV